MKIEISTSAGVALRRSNKRILITKKIKQLAQNRDGLAANVKALKGRDDYRLRVQDWRVIYRIENGTLFIDEIEPRGSAYKD